MDRYPPPLGDITTTLNTKSWLLPSLHSACSSGSLPKVQSTLTYWKYCTLLPDQNINHLGGLQDVFKTACENYHLEIVEFFLSEGLNIEMVAVHEVIRMGWTEGLDAFLRHGWDIDQRWKSWGFPAIIDAISRDDIKMVKFLLDHGASPNLEPSNQLTTTPLSAAALFASLEMAKLLIDNGARVVDCGAVIRDLCHSQFSNRLEMLHYLVEKGAPIDRLVPLPDRIYGRRHTRSGNHGLTTPLHVAVQSGKPYLVEALLGFGADRHIRNSKGLTPLNLALSMNSWWMTELLKEDV